MSEAKRYGNPGALSKGDAGQLVRALQEELVVGRKGDLVSVDGVAMEFDGIHTFGFDSDQGVAVRVRPLPEGRLSTLGDITRETIPVPSTFEWRGDMYKVVVRRRY